MLEGRDKRVLLMDFGIAKAVGAATDGDPGTTLTTTGIIIGTPQYMSPEQAAGDKSIDARSDQYSLAVVGYRMLAGELPFGGDSTRAVLYQQLVATPPPIQTRVANLPGGLANAITRAMLKEPAERFADMLEFAAMVDSELPAIEAEPTAEMPTVRARPAGRKRPLLIAGAVAGAVILVGGWLATRSRPRPTAPVTSVAAAPLPAPTAQPKADSLTASAARAAAARPDTQAAAPAAATAAKPKPCKSPPAARPPRRPARRRPRPRHPPRRRRKAARARPRQPTGPPPQPPAWPRRTPAPPPRSAILGTMYDKGQGVCGESGRGARLVSPRGGVERRRGGVPPLADVRRGARHGAESDRGGRAPPARPRAVAGSARSSSWPTGSRTAPASRRAKRKRPPGTAARPSVATRSRSRSWVISWPAGAGSRRTKPRRWSGTRRRPFRDPVPRHGRPRRCTSRAAARPGMTRSAWTGSAARRA